MSRLRAWIRSFFGFSRTETNAFLILLPLMVLLIFSEPAYRYWFVRQPQDFSKEKKELDSLMATWKWETSDSGVRTTSHEKLFYFNPNQATRADLVELGLERTIEQKKVTYDFERLMPGATKVKTSEFAKYIIENMGAGVLTAAD